jgi:hypothetical protein
MTSIRPRLKALHLVITSLSQNKVKPDKFELWLDEKLNRRITPQLKKLQTLGLTIHFTQDVGPHTKLIPALTKHPDATILTFDDDILYPAGILDALYETHQQYPNTVICNKGREIQFKDGQLLSYNQWKKQGTLLNSPSFRLIPLGYGGVLYPPNALPKQTLDKSLFQSLCKTGDDIWFKAMAMTHSTKAIQTGAFPQKETYLLGTQNFSLKKRHTVPGNNDEHIEKTFAFFNLTEKSFTQ